MEERNIGFCVYYSLSLRTRPERAAFQPVGIGRDMIEARIVFPADTFRKYLEEEEENEL